MKYTLVIVHLNGCNESFFVFFPPLHPPFLLCIQDLLYCNLNLWKFVLDFIFRKIPQQMIRQTGIEHGELRADVLWFQFGIFFFSISFLLCEHVRISQSYAWTHGNDMKSNSIQRIE